MTMLYLSEDHKKLIKRILPKKPDPRYALNAVLLEFAPDGTWLVVTDTHRLFAVRIAAPNDTAQGVPPVLLTREAFTARTVEKNKIDVDSIQARETIDAQFPRWRDAWQPDFATLPTVARVGAASRKNGPWVSGSVSAALEYLTDTTLVFPIVELHQEKTDNPYLWGAQDDTIRYVLMPILAGKAVEHLKTLVKQNLANKKGGV